jgi:hypothetical protein
LKNGNKLCFIVGLSRFLQNWILLFLLMRNHYKLFLTRIFHKSFFP